MSVLACSSLKSQMTRINTKNYQVSSLTHVMVFVNSSEPKPVVQIFDIFC